jgi:class 3 adenylate cyclase/predicted ATPase
MKCGRCDFENPPGFAFCGKCGSPLLSVCPQCGFENPPGLAFCGKCGKPLATQEHLTTADLDHLRTFLPLALVQSLQFDLVLPPPRLLEECTAHLGGLLEMVRAHLPAFLVERVLSDPAPGKIGGQFIHGTLLFADISGFTAMSERLSRVGREGAEEITSIVNRYFDTMLSILREQGGQLITFGGDALLGLFVEPDSAARAAQTALSMQAAMAGLAQIKTSQGVFPLRMKVGLHRGQFFAAQLGTPQGMEYALFGADVNATAATESAATAGQVLLDRATYEAIGVPCRAVPASNGCLAIEQMEPFSSLRPSSFTRSVHPSSFPVEPTLDALRRAVERLDALSPYLPAGLLARIATEPRSASLEGEHRLVSVLFANIHGLGQVADRLGPGREAQIVGALNRYFVAMGDAIHRFGGVINKMDLNDRGDKLLAFFGAPQAHEDDAERAVRAALAMQATLGQVACTLPDYAGLPDLCLSQHIGISYGYVYAGYVGAAWRREYTVMGDDVNVAARLMSAAQPGDTLVSANVRRKVQALFELASRGEIKLKGKAEPASVFAVQGVRAMPEPLRGLRGMRSPLVGREAEWEQLGAAMNQLMAGRGQIVSVLGEAGLGKSRLVAEMRQQARTASSPGVAMTQWVEGRCLSYTEAVSFMPFQESLRQMAGIRQDDSATEAWAKLRSLLEKHLAPEEAQAHLPYLTTFLNLPLDESQQDKVRYLDAEALQRRTFVAISALVEAEARGAPVVLVFEDIHWIDPASQRLLEFLMPLVDRSPLMLLLLYRPERSKACWQIHEKAMREFSHCSMDIALRPLDLGQSRELLTNLVKLDRWPVEIGELILGRTEGNPLFVEEMIRALMDDRVLVQDEGGQWQLGGSLDANRLPDTLQGVMMARLDRLEEPARWTAQVASVEGRIFDFDVLSHVDTEHRGDLSPCLVRLQQHEIVRETQRAPFLTYTFRHAMMHEVCYNSLLARVRRLYHCRIAEYLEATRSDESDTAVIAHHAFLGQDWPRALRYQLLAGEQARRMFANLNAIEHLERAAECVSHLPPAETFEQRLKIDLMQGELLTMTGQYDHALEHLDAARAQAVERGDQDAQACACRWLARLHELRGEYPAAFDWIQQGLQVLQGRETTEAAEMLLVAGLIHTRQGNTEDALTQCERGLRIAQDLGQVTVLARAYNLLGHITRLRGHSAQAIDHFQKSFELYASAGDIGGQALAQNQIANAYYDVSQWREADHHYRQAREAFSLLGDVYNQAIANNNLGGIALNQGSLDGALADYREALRQMEQIGGSPWALGVLNSNLGGVLLRRGEVDAARRHLTRGQEYFDRANVRDSMPELRRRQAEAALVAGDLGEAESLGRQAFALAQELAMRNEQGFSLRVLGEIALARGHLEQAGQNLSESVAILAEVGDEYEGARSKLALARVYAAQGQRAEATSVLERCIPVFERLEAALDLAAAREMMNR